MKAVTALTVFLVLTLLLAYAMFDTTTPPTCDTAGSRIADLSHCLEIRAYMMEVVNRHWEVESQDEILQYTYAVLDDTFAFQLCGGNDLIDDRVLARVELLDQYTTRVGRNPLTATEKQVIAGVYEIIQCSYGPRVSKDCLDYLLNISTVAKLYQMRPELFRHAMNRACKKEKK